MLKYSLVDDTVRQRQWLGRSPWSLPRLVLEWGGLSSAWTRQSSALQSSDEMNPRHHHCAGFGRAACPSGPGLVENNTISGRRVPLQPPTCEQQSLRLCGLPSLALPPRCFSLLQLPPRVSHSCFQLPSCTYLGLDDQPLSGASSDPPHHQIKSPLFRMRHSRRRCTFTVAARPHGSLAAL